MKKNLTFLLLLLCLVLGSTALLSALSPSPEPESSESAENTDPLDTGIPVAPLEGAVTHVEIAWADGRTLSYEVNGDVYTVENLDSSVQFSQYRLGVTAKVGASMTADQVVEHPEEDLSLYGLAEPHITITYRSDTGDSVRLFLGNSTAAQNTSDNYVYLKNDKADAVYLENALNVRYLGRTLEEYRELTLLPKHWIWVEKFNSVIDTMELMQVERNGELAIRLRRGTVQELAHRPDGNAPFVFDYPAYCYANPDRLYGRYIERILRITLGSSLIHESAGPADFARYGLDNPETVITIDDGEQTYRFLLNQPEGDSFCYIAREDLSAIVSVPASGLKLDFYLAELADTAFWKFREGEVVGIHVEQDNSAWDVVLSEEGSALNGSPISGDDANTILEAVLAIAPEDMAEQSEATSDCTITITLLDGGAHTLSMQQLNARQYAVTLNGTPSGMYCKAADLELLFLALEEARP